MILKNAEFKFVDRGFKEVLVCLPGWACDYRIFSRLNLDYNYIFAVSFSPFNFREQLADYLRRISVSKVSLLGYSLGAFLAVDFAKSHPDKINELILISIRKNYEPKVLQEIKLKLKDNKEAYLYKFYMNCFSKSDRQGLDWFKKNLLKDYLQKMEPEYLNEGLDYLEKANIEGRVLKKINEISIFHGEDDLIAPIKEAVLISAELEGVVRFIAIPKAGHICFLNESLKKDKL